MIGGTILSHSVQGDVVTFKVKEKESSSQCHVKAKMDQHAQKLIDNGADIWWAGKKVYLRIGDVPDCQFEKIGFSY